MVVKQDFIYRHLMNKLKKKRYPSIGIILCQSKNNKIVDYTIKYINKPIGVVSNYKTLDKLPIDYMKSLPTEDDLNMYIGLDN